MNNVHLLDPIPLWAIFLATPPILLIAIALGIVTARSWKKRSEDHAREPVNTLVGSILALLAFILTFTFGLTASRYEARKELLLDEVNAIETTFLRAALIPEPHSSNVRALLRRYVDLRVKLSDDPKFYREALEQSDRLQGRLWKEVATLSKEDLKNVAMARLFVISVNEMIDLQTKRITVALIYRIPPLILVSLFCLTVLSMFGVGYLIGTSTQSHWTLILILALSFSIVIALIFDLDRSGTAKRGVGIIQVSSQPMIDLQRRINAPARE